MDKKIETNSLKLRRVLNTIDEKKENEMDVMEEKLKDNVENIKKDGWGSSPQRVYISSDNNSDGEIDYLKFNGKKSSTTLGI